MATLSELVSKTTEIKNDLATCHAQLKTNLTGKGVTVSSSEKMLTLINKINDIKTGFELPMTVPSYTVNIGTITATCNTQAGLFVEFKLNDNGTWQKSNVFTGLSPVTSYTFYGRTSNGFTNSIKTTTPKANQAKPEIPTYTRSGATITVTAASGCKIRYNNTLYTSPYAFTNLDGSVSHFFYSVKEATSSLNEAVSDVLEVKTELPGSSTLAVGDLQNGVYGSFYGIITGSKLKEALGMTEGTLRSTGLIQWIKYAWKGKTLYIAKNQLMKEISWNNLNARGIIAGKIITIDNIKYKVRTVNQASTSSTATAYEYIGLMAKWYSSYPYDYTYACWCDTKYDSTSAILTNTTSYNSLSYATAYVDYNDWGWRPVLEVYEG